MIWRRLGFLYACLLGLSSLATPALVAAATVPNDFNLQVTPSPLVTTVKPGVKSQVELKVRNSGSGTEALKIEPRSFKFDSKTGKVSLEDTTPPDIAAWISFSQPKFTVNPGEWATEQVIFSVPKDAGFSYSFALVINRQNNPKPADGTRAINGSLAVFTLVNVDRPGAKSDLQVSSFTASKKVYEYLPSNFTVRFHNVGNTITQPYGNIFIGRGSNAAAPMGSLVVNETKGYILPGTERTISAQWSDGFPVYRTTAGPDGKSNQKLVWNWGNLSKLRIGRYTAHLVGVYNQAGHDVPIEGSVSFWVIPWKILLGLLLIVLLVLFALFMVGLFIFRRLQRRSAHRRQKKAAKSSASSAEPENKL